MLASWALARVPLPVTSELSEHKGDHKHFCDTFEIRRRFRDVKGGQCSSEDDRMLLKVGVTEVSVAFGDEEKGMIGIGVKGSRPR